MKPLLPLVAAALCLAARAPALPDSPVTLASRLCTNRIIASDGWNEVRFLPLVHERVPASELGLEPRERSSLERSYRDFRDLYKPSTSGERTLDLFNRFVVAHLQISQNRFQKWDSARKREDRLGADAVAAMAKQAELSVAETMARLAELRDLLRAAEAPLTFPVAKWWETKVLELAEQRLFLAGFEPRRETYSGGEGRFPALSWKAPAESPLLAFERSLNELEPGRTYRVWLVPALVYDQRDAGIEHRWPDADDFVLASAELVRLLDVDMHTGHEGEHARCEATKGEEKPSLYVGQAHAHRGYALPLSTPSSFISYQEIWTGAWSVRYYGRRLLEALDTWEAPFVAQSLAGFSRVYGSQVEDIGNLVAEIARVTAELRADAAGGTLFPDRHTMGIWRTQIGGGSHVIEAKAAGDKRKALIGFPIDKAPSGRFFVEGVLLASTYVFRFSLVEPELVTAARALVGKEGDPGIEKTAEFARLLEAFEGRHALLYSVLVGFAPRVGAVIEAAQAAVERPSREAYERAARSAMALEPPAIEGLPPMPGLTAP